MCAGTEWKIFDKPRTEILIKEWFISTIMAVWLVPGWAQEYILASVS
jgi:hypothetical protein